MPKNLFQDMVKAKNPKREVFNQEISKRNISQQTDMQEVHNFVDSIQQNKRGSKYGIWIVAAISIVFFLFAMSFLFARAQVVVNPKIQELNLDASLSAIKDVNIGGLAFDLVIISGEENTQIAGEVEQDVSLPAKGTAIIYNTFSLASQNFAINTRLEGSNGKIYKTTEAVVVPGTSEDGTPGKLEVNIYAADPGAEYNSDPLDFKIFGFKGTSKYDKFYARSTSPLSGGFKGKGSIVSDTDKEQAFSKLKLALTEKLIKKATDQIPAGFVLYKDAAFLNVDEQNVGLTSVGGTLPVNMKGTLYGILLNENELTQSIAKDTISGYNDEEVYIPNIKDLTFSLKDASGAINNEVQNISFSLTGSAKVVWKFDDVRFTEELLGKSKNDFNQILGEYINVDSAQLTLSPFWIRTIPDKIKDIKIIVNYPK